MRRTAELDLALACCRRGFAGDSDAALRDLANGIDWPRFVRLARRHRVQGLIAQALRKSRIPVPAASESEISKDALEIAERNVRSAAECTRLLQQFSDARVPLLFIKGLTLSALAYGDPFLKMGVDIDILVPAESITRSAEILAGAGYRLAIPSTEPSPGGVSMWHATHKESLWVNPESGIGIDLHTRLSDNRALIPAIGMTSQRQEVEVGAGRSLPTLETDDLFAYLCVHGASSAWFRMKWIADLAAFVHTAGNGDTERLYRHAVARGAGRAPAQALLLAERLSLLDLPPALRTELRADLVNRLLAGAAFRLIAHDRAPTERVLGTLPIHWTQPLLLKAWGFKLSEAGRQVREILYSAA